MFMKSRVAMLFAVTALVLGGVAVSGCGKSEEQKEMDDIGRAIEEELK